MACDRMKVKLLKNGRCPFCTLQPPCKHFEKSDDIPVTEIKKQLGPGPIRNKSRSPIRALPSNSLNVSHNRANFNRTAVRMRNQETTHLPSIQNKSRIKTKYGYAAMPDQNQSVVVAKHTKLLSTFIAPHV